ncbi:hypothetical protein LCGC14_0993910 [marine sediment metagenome]|uniref:Uncharacterized protein n=1 Tax=marine sediment metagenome TaxID=412755 RepID=A0A0F9N502_9ZZZZ
MNKKEEQALISRLLELGKENKEETKKTEKKEKEEIAEAKAESEKEEEKEKEEKKLEEEMKEIAQEMKELEEKKDKKDEISKKESKKLKKKDWRNNLFNAKKFKRPNRVAVVYLRNNGIAEPMQVDTKDGFFSINGKTYHERKDCVYSFHKDRIPFAVIPEWSMTPIGTKRWEEQTMHEKFNELQDHLLRGIRHAELVRRTGVGMGGMDAKKMIGLGILVMVGMVVLFNYI